MNKKLLMLLSVVSVNLLAGNLFAMRLPACMEYPVDRGDMSKKEYFRLLLFRAVKMDNITVIRALAQAPCDGRAALVDVNIRDDQGNTPLHYARTVEAVRALIDAGANVDAVDREGNTALHLAVAMAHTGDNWYFENLENSVEIVKTLIEHGADTQIASLSGVRTIDMARRYLDYADGDHLYRILLTAAARDRLNRIIVILTTPIESLATLAARRLRLADVVAAAERGMDGDVDLLSLVDRVGIKDSPDAAIFHAAYDAAHDAGATDSDAGRAAEAAALNAARAVGYSLSDAHALAARVARDAAARADSDARRAAYAAFRAARARADICAADDVGGSCGGGTGAGDAGAGGEGC